LSPARRERIADELRRSDLNLQNVASLLEALTAAIGRFDSWRDLREKSRPANVRENLKAALKAAERLNKRLYALDGNSSCLLIREAAHVDALSLHRQLDAIVQPLFAASQLAQEYPHKGNLPETERL
jgi:hypothetical protein